MIFLTGCAGFIGFHTCLALLQRGEAVIGLDNLNDYYDPALKTARLARLQAMPGFTFFKDDIASPQAVDAIVRAHPQISIIVHLAAQAGVRYSLENPYAYAASNLTGQVVMLEAARRLPHLKHFVYASSSSVYGMAQDMPLVAGRTQDDRPVSLYAATKKSGEVLTQSYAHLYGFAATGLRFFTVYGPWGRPDMAYYKFTKAIFEDRQIEVFNHGDLARDFTYIDDIVNGIMAAIQKPARAGDAHTIDNSAHRIFNLGNNTPVKLNDFIAAIEHAVGRKALKIMAPMAPGDVKVTFADIAPAQDILGYKPTTAITDGIPLFVNWYKDYAAC